MNAQALGARGGWTSAVAGLAAVGIAAVLAACTVAPTPTSQGSASAIPSALASPSSVAPSASPAQPSSSPRTQATDYVVRWQNDDEATYHVELIEKPPGDALSIYHPWTIGPGETGVVEVPSTFAGELQVRLLTCDAVAQWVVQPGRYEVIIRGGQATLQPTAAAAGLVPMPTASTCIFSGP